MFYQRCGIWEGDTDRVCFLAKMIAQRTPGVDFRDRGQKTCGLVKAFLFVCYATWLSVHINEISTVGLPRGTEMGPQNSLGGPGCAQGVQFPDFPCCCF